MKARNKYGLLHPRVPGKTGSKLAVGCIQKRRLRGRGRGTRQARDFVGEWQRNVSTRAGLLRCHKPYRPSGVPPGCAPH